MGLSQTEFAKRAKVGVNTVIRMERGEISPRRGTSWSKIEEFLGWPGGYFEDFLAGRVDESLEARYRREPVTDGQIVQMTEDMIYEAFIAAAPDTPLSQIDKARKAAFEVLERNGIRVAKRHPEESQGTEADS